MRQICVKIRLDIFVGGQKQTWAPQNTAFLESWGKNKLPCSGEEAGDSSDVCADEIAEVKLGEVSVHMWLQDLCPQGPLQGQQGAIVMHLQLCLAAVTLHGANQLYMPMARVMCATDQTLPPTSLCINVAS